MSSVGGVAGPVATDSGLPVNQDASSKSVDGAHSQFGKVLVGGADMDFAEELSMTLHSLKKFETKDNKKDKDLRKELERLKETVPDLPGMEKMDKFLQQLQQAKKSGQLSQDKIKEYSQEYSGDSSHQYLALQALADHLEEQDPDLAAELRNYNSEFYEQNKVDIQGGLNVTQEHYDMAEKAGMSPQECRDEKREKVLHIAEFSTLQEAYHYLIEGLTPPTQDKIQERADRRMAFLAGEMLAMKNPRMTCAVGATELVFIRKQLEFSYGLATVIELSSQNEMAIGRRLASAAAAA